MTNERLAITLKTVQCRDCGHTAVLHNQRDYAAITSPDEFEIAPRVGTEDRPGREFQMCRLAIAALDRSELDVLVYGAGRSLDNRHIERLSRVASVAIGDVARFRNDAAFVDTSRPATKKFDIVIACEVIEHFVHPHRDFPALFDFVADDGLLICSTNINDGSELAKHGYMFVFGHVSYYTPAALRSIARRAGYLADFRVPRTALGQAGRRKRYVLFSRSQEVMEGVSDFFGSHVYAPSEAPTPR